MKKVMIYIAALALLVGPAGIATAADVAQGKTVSYDKDKKVLTIDEYNTNFTPPHKYGEPTGKQLVFNTANSLIGITPAAGDIVRIAYKPEGNANNAIRVMNVSKQDLMKK